jgi:two-component system response regulator HydG
MESELFGHERGAFTGADRQKPGLFERAQGGTVFLDEVAELAPDAQVRLLRVLETRRVMRVGGTREIAVDVRLLAATHRDLRSLVSAGTFRQDLLYRILVLVIELPPLRAHLDDVRILAGHLLDEMRGSLPRRVRGFSEDALVKLETHMWPGNVRELRNTIERAAVLGRGDVISAKDIVLFTPTSSRSTASEDATKSLKDVEAAHVQRVLESVAWNKARAAEILGIGRPTVYEKIKQHDLRPIEGESEG